MPGIAGIISSVPETDLFQAFLRKLNHFDYKTDSFFKEGIHLGRVHLDYVNRAPQPVFSDDKRFALVMVGEIFSFRDTEPEEIDHDAGFLLDVIVQKGISVLSEINGQYVAAMHDFLERKTFLFTDRYGTRPLYYTIHNRRLLFSSELKSLLSGNLQVTINPDALSDLFHLRHLFGTKTMVKEISQLPHSSILIFTDGKVQIEKYHDLLYDDEIYYNKKLSKREVNEYSEGFREVMEKAMKRVFIKNSKDILFSLSGGLDSRYVIAYARKYQIDPLETFTIGPPECGDQKYAGKVAEKVGARHKAFPVLADDFWENAGKFSYFSDGMSQIFGPAALMPVLNDYSGKRKITVSSQIIDAITGSTLDRRRVKKIVGSVKFGGEVDDIFRNLFKHSNDHALQTVFNNETYLSIKDSYSTVPEQYIKNYPVPAHSYFMLFLNEHGRRGIFGGNLLTNLFMEMRMPSYDNDLMDFSLKLPMKLRENQYLYRKVFTSLFPDLAKIEREGTDLPVSASNIRLKIKDTEKKLMIYARQTPLHGLMNRLGFREEPGYVNLAGWFRNELKKKMLDFVLSEKVMSRGLYNKKGLKKVVDQHITGAKDHAELLWQIINLEYFYENFMD